MLNGKKTAKRDIHDRLYKFALRVLGVVRLISHTPENLVLIRQVVRSSCSVGANAMEADAAETRREFIHRFTIAKKEGKETFYWLSLLTDHNPRLKQKFVSVLKENQELVAIISKIIINAKANG